MDGEWSAVYFQLLLESAAVNIAARASPVGVMQKFRLQWWRGLVKSKRKSISEERRTVGLGLLRLHDQDSDPHLRCSL